MNTQQLERRIEKLETATTGWGSGRVFLLVDNPCDEGADTMELAIEAAGFTPHSSDDYMVVRVVAADNGNLVEHDLPSKYRLMDGSAEHLNNNQEKIS